MNLNCKEKPNKNTLIPERWLHCPRKSVGIIYDKFFAFKTPLSSEYDTQVPEENRFFVKMLMDYFKSQKFNLGLWIDLTNTSRFYDKTELESYGVSYVKLPCRGHEETPDIEQTELFIKICKKFIAQNPLQTIGVHCTHGFNRTGFLIVSYLVESEDFSLDAALALFAEHRSPGIYKHDYIEELYRRYDEVQDCRPAPPRPAWCLEYDDSDIVEGDANNTSGPTFKRRKVEFQNKNPTFMPGVPGVTPITDFRKASGIQVRVQYICGWDRGGFPGSQPVSMDMSNIELLHQKPYRVSWKADGTRYMMLIQGDGQVYFIDRDNSVFQVAGLTFPSIKDPMKKLKDTLLDGEMVIDKYQGKEFPRYLAYDILMCDGQNVSEKPFYPDRYRLIQSDVIAGRDRAVMEGRLDKSKEPFAVRRKEFWEVTNAAYLLSDKFTKKLSHEPDGLIFQPKRDSYVAGQCPYILKWKPSTLNSVDFRLKKFVEEGEGILRKIIGHLYVGGLDTHFDKIKWTASIKDLDNKIIECKIENGNWVFMRERTDKSFPNSLATAQGVIKSIRNPVTVNILTNYIHDHRFIEDTELMPPPTPHFKKH